MGSERRFAVHCLGSGEGVMQGPLASVEACQALGSFGERGLNPGQPFCHL
jgi:hypothetical protein